MNIIADLTQTVYSFRLDLAVPKPWKDDEVFLKLNMNIIADLTQTVYIFRLELAVPNLGKTIK
jgi:hypothetical protein